MRGRNPPLTFECQPINRASLLPPDGEKPNSLTTSQRSCGNGDSYRHTAMKAISPAAGWGEKQMTVGQRLRFITPNLTSAIKQRLPDETYL